MSVLRDVPFAEYGTDKDAQAIVRSLNGGQSTTSAPLVGGEITNQSLFRGRGLGELVGPYVSQFLYTPFDFGNFRYDQRYDVEADVDASVTAAGWLDIQQGVTGPGATRTGDFKYCHSGRVLGAVVPRRNR